MIFKRLTQALLFILSACGSAILIFSIFTPLVSGFLIFALLSLILFSWATLGRLGWAIQTWGGKSDNEKLDLRILWTLYWLGTFFGTLALLT